MSLGNGNYTNGNKGSNFNYELKVLQGLEKIQEAATNILSNQLLTDLNFKPGSVGPKVSFTKVSGSDPETNKDIIIPGVIEITRGNSGGGIYNIAYESSFNGSQSPLYTLWNTQYVDSVNTSWAPLWDIQNRTYDTWRNAIEIPNDDNDPAPPQYVGIPAIMSVPDGGYWLIKFTHWGIGDNGDYGFAYDRWEILNPVYFEKPNYETDTVDIISNGVHIARNDNGGLYNAVIEEGSENGASPINTKWNSQYVDSRPGYSGWDDLSNLESRVYASFVDALDGNVGNNIDDGTDLVMWDMTTDLYYKIDFDFWTQSGNGGGFGYVRTVIPQSLGIKFADGTVMNTATTGGGSTGGGSIATDGSSLYSVDPVAGPGFSTNQAILLGANAGFNASNALQSNFFGSNAGNDATNAYSSNFIGDTAGFQATNAYQSNFFGQCAGRFATNASYSNFFGSFAGQNATNAPYSNFFGNNAGVDANNASYSNFLGNHAGDQAVAANNSNFLGQYAGFQASSANNSNFMGYWAGLGAQGANNSNFMGYRAGISGFTASESNFIGYEAGANGTSASRCNFIGYRAGYSCTGNNVNAFGANAGLSNTLNGQTIFSNASMPTFANHAAAALAITVALGASAGSTYLYHNQATNSIGAVRL